MKNKRFDYSSCCFLAGFAVLYVVIIQFNPVGDAVPGKVSRMLLAATFCALFVCLYTKTGEPLALCCMVPAAWVLASGMKRILFRYCAIPSLGERLVTDYSMFLAIAVYLSVKHEWASAGFTPPSRWRRVSLIAPPLYILVLGVIGYLYIFWHGSYVRIRGSILLSKSFLLTVLALECIFTGLSEEGLYRGIVLNALRGYGLLQAVLVSSLLFGMMHINYFSAGILTGATVVIYTSLFGICCAALRICTGTIWLPIVFHALNNYLLQLHRTDSRLLFGARPAFWPENAAYTLLLDSILAIYGLFILKRYSGDALADGLPFGEVHRNNGVTQSRQDQ